MNQRHTEARTTSFPKGGPHTVGRGPSRWLSHYRFEPRSIEFTSEGEVEGKMSWLMGSLFDFSFTRSVFAPYYSKEGGHCFDPASLFFLELAGWVDPFDRLRTGFTPTGPPSVKTSASRSRAAATES